MGVCLHSADIVFELGETTGMGKGKKPADVIMSALLPESLHDISRTNTHMERKGESLALRIEAEDLTSLRAAVNSYMRWIEVATAVSEDVSRNTSK